MIPDRAWRAGIVVCSCTIPLPMLPHTPRSLHSPSPSLSPSDFPPFSPHPRLSSPRGSHSSDRYDRQSIRDSLLSFESYADILTEMGSYNGYDVFRTGGSRLIDRCEIGKMEANSDFGTSSGSRSSSFTNKNCEEKNLNTCKIPVEKEVEVVRVVCPIPRSGSVAVAEIRFIPLENENENKNEKGIYKVGMENPRSLKNPLGENNSLDKNKIKKENAEAEHLGSRESLSQKEGWLDGNEEGGRCSVGEGVEGERLSGCKDSESERESEIEGNRIHVTIRVMSIFNILKNCLPIDEEREKEKENERGERGEGGEDERCGMSREEKLELRNTGYGLLQSTIGKDVADFNPSGMFQIPIYRSILTALLSLPSVTFFYLIHIVFCRPALTRCHMHPILMKRKSLCYL